MSVSILDVAARAGVSKSTVSRVLNGGSVSEKARVKVHKAINELSFSPNAFATALRGRQCRIIGVVIDDYRMFRQKSEEMQCSIIMTTLTMPEKIRNSR